MEWPAGERDTPETGVHQLLPKAIVDMLVAWDAEAETLVSRDDPPIAGNR